MFKRAISKLSLIIIIAIVAGYGLPPLIGHAAATNLMANPLVETANPTNSTQPLDWQTGTWGTNTTTLSYLDSGSTGDTNSVNVDVSAYSSGASEWYDSPVSVSAGSEYTYSDYYESTAPSEVDAAFNLSDGSTQYVYLGGPAASSTWQNFSANFTAPSGATSVSIYHLLYGVGSLTTDNFSLTSTSTPTISITSPSASSTVSGSDVQLTANASDPNGISSVQFQVNGSNVGSPITSTPYEYTWNSTTVANGSYEVTAVATNSEGVSVTSSPVQVEVNNPIAVGTNIVPNSLLETINPANTTEPLDWIAGTYGTNTTNFSYLDSGSSGDSNSVEAQITSYSSGSSEWLPAPIPVSQDQQYKFSDYYKTNVPSEVDASFYMSDGTIDYQILGFPTPSTSWNKFSTTFSVPLGAQSVSIYQYIDTVGYVTTDNYSITPYTPVGFSSPLVSLTFDDGYADTFSNGLPLLQQYGMPSTQFIITDEIGDSGYMTSSQIDTLFKDGEDIGSHTVTHDDLTGETASEVQSELSQSQKTLDSITGSKVTSFAYPYGYYNSAVTNKVKSYYTSARGVEDGLNSKDNFNAYDLKVQDIYSTTTTAQVADWVAQAQATDTWLILVYHSVDPDTTSSFDGNIYNVTPTQLSSELAAIKSSGIKVVTVAQAMKLITPQL